MKHLILLFFLISNVVFAQVIEGGAFAVINDKDGYVNVRKEKSVHSKVLKKLGAEIGRASCRERV